MTRTRPATSITPPIAIGDRRRRRPLEREDLDRVLRSLRAEPRSVEERAAPAFGGPLLARAEVVDVAEHDVAHRRALGDGEREREERDAALRVHRAVDRVDDDSALSACAERAHAELLRDEHEVLVESGESRDDGVLGRLVDRGRLVAALAEPQHRLALGPRRQSRRARRGCPRRRAGRSRARASSIERVEEEPGERLGKEVRALRRHPLAAARDCEDVVDARLAEEERHVCLAAVDRRDGLVATRRVRDAVEAVPVDELRRRARPRDRGRARRSRVDTRSRPERSYGSFVETEQRLVEVAAGLALAQLLEIRPAREDAVRRKDVQTRRRPSTRRAP